VDRITLRDLNLYTEPQDNAHCGAIALNVLLNKPVFKRQSQYFYHLLEASADELQLAQADRHQHYWESGQYTIEAIAHVVWECTDEHTNVMPLEIFSTGEYKSEGWHYNQDTILNAAPSGCNALLLNYMIGTGDSKIAHWATWKKRGQNWYDLDSLLHSRTGGKARLVNEADWESFEGTIYCWTHIEATKRW
jgi:hypothetical protein